MKQSRGKIRKKNLLRSVVGILVVGTFLSCSSSSQFRQKESSGLRYQTIGAEKYGRGVEFRFNSTKTAVLCMKEAKTTLLVPQRQVAFFVFDVTADSILFEDNLANGSVGWNDEFSIIVKIVPGIEESEERSPHRPPGYIFDLRSKKTKNLESVVVQ